MHKSYVLNKHLYAIRYHFHGCTRNITCNRSKQSVNFDMHKLPKENSTFKWCYWCDMETFQKWPTIINRMLKYQRHLCIVLQSYLLTLACYPASLGLSSFWPFILKVQVDTCMHLCVCLPTVAAIFKSCLCYHVDVRETIFNNLKQSNRVEEAAKKHTSPKQELDCVVLCSV